MIYEFARQVMFKSGITKLEEDLTRLGKLLKSDTLTDLAAQYFTEQQTETKAAIVRLKKEFSEGKS